MGRLGELQANKNGNGYKIKIGNLEKIGGELTLKEGQVLFLQPTEDYYNGLVEAGIIDSDTAKANLAKVPDFVRMIVTGVSKS